MLPKKQAVYRLAKGMIYPYKLSNNKENIDLLQQMIELMSKSVGEKKVVIEESLLYFARQLWQPKVMQAIIKLLLEKGEFNDGRLAEDISLFRADIFDSSAKFWNKLKSLPKLEKIAPTILDRSKLIFHDYSLESLESKIYGDLPDNQKLQSFQKISAEDFIQWFNNSMVRCILLQAKKIELNFYSYQENMRQFMRYLKFFGLLFNIKNENNSWILELDGPESILDSGRNYGVDFSNIFSAILLLKGDWEMKAAIYLAIKKQIYQLKIEPLDGYKSFYSEKDLSRNQIITDFVNEWNEHNSSDTAELTSKIFQLKDNLYLLPDFCIKTKKGKIYYFELLRYYSIQVPQIKFKVKSAPKNYYFLIIGQKKKLLDKFEEFFEKELLLCFNKNLTVPKIANFLASK